MSPAPETSSQLRTAEGTLKVGSGAFVPVLGGARELARAIVDVAVGNGMPTVALLTDMNQVLGRTAGNAVEVRESIDHLTGAASRVYKIMLRRFAFYVNR